MVRSGRVRVDGREVREPRRWVSPDACVEVDGQRVGPPAQQAHVYAALNKPRGVVSTTRDPEGRPTVMDLVASKPWAVGARGLAPVGRLDLASAGLLLLTTDHALADRLLDPRSRVSKRYRVKVRGHPSPEDLETLRRDTLEEDGLRLGPMDVLVTTQGPRSAWLEVTLREGKNRHIRRRLEALDYDVETLVRTRFGPIELGDLAPGEARLLTAQELIAVHRADGERGS